MNLQIDVGVRTYKINEKVEVSFNPTDISFLAKTFDVFDTLDMKQDEYKKMIEEGGQVFDLTSRLDREMRDEINSLFGVDVCTPLFGSISVLALASGMPLWCNLLLAVIDEADRVVGTEAAESRKRVEKYTKKYRR